MVREVTLDAQGRATGVHFIDKKTGQEEHAAARAVILGASALRDRAHPAQLDAPPSFRKASAIPPATSAAGSPTPPAANLGGQIPALENLPLHNEDGTSLDAHLRALFARRRRASAKAMGSPRGYYMAWGGGRQMPGHRAP